MSNHKMHLTGLGSWKWPSAYQGGTERQPPAESAGLDSFVGSNTNGGVNALSLSHSLAP